MDKALSQTWQTAEHGAMVLVIFPVRVLARIEKFFNLLVIIILSYQNKNPVMSFGCLR